MLIVRKMVGIMIGMWLGISWAGFAQKQEEHYIKIPLRLVVCEQYGSPEGVDLMIYDTRTRFMIRQWIETTDDVKTNWLVFPDIYKIESLKISLLAAKKNSVHWGVYDNIPFDKFKTADSIIVEIIDTKVHPFYRDDKFYEPHKYFIVDLCIYWHDEQGKRVFYGVSLPAPTYPLPWFYKHHRKLIRNCRKKIKK
jgi:hypothetical protein